MAVLSAVGFFTAHPYLQSAQSPDDVNGTPNGQTWFLLFTAAVHQSCSVGLDVLVAGHSVNIVVVVLLARFVASTLVVYGVPGSKHALFNP